MAPALWGTIRRDVHKNYAPRLRNSVMQRLRAHPGVAFRLLLKSGHANIVTRQCTKVQTAPNLLAFQTSSAFGPDPATGSAAPTGLPGAWNLVWSDEFNKASLDTNRWSTGWFGSGVTSPVNSSEQGCYDPSQVATSGGTLNLTAISKAQTVNGTTYPYTSGLVTTMGKFSFTYGVVEARIYLPGSGGAISNWPAFWADGTGTWPTTGELDVMEGLGGTAAYHFHSNSGGPGASAAGNFTGWHTYAADWQPGRVTYYYDGREVGQVTQGITGSPMYLILNDAVDHTYGGPVSTPSTMKVDYVRVWQ